MKSLNLILVKRHKAVALVECTTAFYGALTGGVLKWATGYVYCRCGDGTDVVGTLVLDATGHARRLVEFDKKFDPGYQGAYGVLIGMRFLMKMIAAVQVAFKS